MLYPQNIIHGALFVLLSELMFASMGALVKTVSIELPNEVTVFLRNLIGLLLLTAWFWHQGFSRLKTQVIHLHFLRATMGLAAMYCFFYALANLHLAEGLLLKMTAPFFIPFIAWLWLKESAPRLALLALPVGFIGVALILKPNGDFNWVVLIGLLGGLLAAIAKTTVRRLGRSEPTSRVVFYFAFQATLISSIPMLWAWQMPGMHAWLLLLGISITGTLGQLLLTRAYSIAQTAQIAPLTYFSIIYGSVIGYVFWGEILDIYFIAGAVLIAIAGLLAIRRPENKLSPTVVSQSTIS